MNPSSSPPDGATRASCPASAPNPSGDAPEPGRAGAPLAAALASAGPERLARLLRHHTAGALVGALTHDLSQPLAAIGMYGSAAARMVELGRADSAELAQVLRQIEAQVGRAGDLLSRVRALTRLGSPPAPAADLCRSAADAVGLARTLANGKRISVELKAPAGPLTVAVDPQVVAQVLFAVLFNALEALDAPDALWAPDAFRALDPLVLDERRIEVRVDAEPLGALVTVRDTGPGLERGRLTRLFSGLPSEKPRGCGLGLALARSLVSAHGGDLWADPETPGGAVLHLRLPLATGTQPPAHPDAVSAP